MQNNKNGIGYGCPLMLNRRKFLTTMGTAAVVAQSQVFDFASSLFAAEEPKPHDGPLVSVGTRRAAGERWVRTPGEWRQVVAGRHHGNAQGYSREI